LVLRLKTLGEDNITRKILLCVDGSNLQGLSEERIILQGSSEKEILELKVLRRAQKGNGAMSALEDFTGGRVMLMGVVEAEKNLRSRVVRKGKGLVGEVSACSR